MKSGIAKLTVLIVLTAGATACGGSATKASQASATATVTVTAAPSVSPPSVDAKINDSQETAAIKATVLGARQNVPSDFDDQPRWMSVLVRVCAKVDKDAQGPIEVSWVPWSVADADDGSYDITGVTGGITYPLPTYPTDPAKRLRKGQCVKGWITFNVQPGVKVTSVTYAPGKTDPLTWLLKS